MNYSSTFQLKPEDFIQLDRYLRDDPNDVTAGIPGIIVKECHIFIDLLIEVERINQLDDQGLLQTRQTFIQTAIEKALLMILNRPINWDDPVALTMAVAKLESAKVDLERRNDESLPESQRLAITDWDPGRIFCVVFKVALRNAKANMLVTA